MSIIPRLVFHSQGQCWKIFSLPTRSLYYSGHMVWWSWWRIGLAWENFAKREGCECPSCRPLPNPPTPTNEKGAGDE